MIETYVLLRAVPGERARLADDLSDLDRVVAARPVAGDPSALVARLRSPTRRAALRYLATTLRVLPGVRSVEEVDAPAEERRGVRGALWALRREPEPPLGRGKGM